MADRVELFLGDLFSEPCDIIVLPSSQSGLTTTRTQTDIDTYWIPAPRLTKPLGETELIGLPEGHTIARFVCWAASVGAYASVNAAIRNIGKRLAEYAESYPDAKLISSPLLGTGAGQLQESASARALAEGFLSGKPNGATLRIVVEEEAEYRELQAVVANVVQKHRALSGDQIEELRDALIAAFSKDELQMMTHFELDVLFDTVVGDGTFETQVYQLILWAERNGRTVDLIRGARSQVPGNQRLREFAESMGID